VKRMLERKNSSVCCPCMTFCFLRDDENVFGVRNHTAICTSWRERVEVESTTHSAKERVAGFEGREGHRTPFAPVSQ